jgi:hypothetical protein
MCLNRISSILTVLQRCFGPNLWRATTINYCSSLRGEHINNGHFVMAARVSNPLDLLEDKYPKFSCLVDAGALLVLVAALFMPVVRVGLGTLRLADQNYSVAMFGGIALIGLLASQPSTAKSPPYAAAARTISSITEETNEDLKDTHSGRCFQSVLNGVRRYRTLCVVGSLSKAVPRNVER